MDSWFLRVSACWNPLILFTTAALWLSPSALIRLALVEIGGGPAAIMIRMKTSTAAPSHRTLLNSTSFSRRVLFAIGAVKG